VDDHEKAIARMRSYLDIEIVEIPIEFLDEPQDCTVDRVIDAGELEAVATHETHVSSNSPEPRPINRDHEVKMGMGASRLLGHLLNHFRFASSIHAVRCNSLQVPRNHVGHPVRAIALGLRLKMSTTMKIPSHQTVKHRKEEDSLEDDPGLLRPPCEKLMPRRVLLRLGIDRILALPRMAVPRDLRLPQIMLRRHVAWVEATGDVVRTIVESLKYVHDFLASSFESVHFEDLYDGDSFIELVDHPCAGLEVLSREREIDIDMPIVAVWARWRKQPVRIDHLALASWQHPDDWVSVVGSVVVVDRTPHDPPRLRYAIRYLAVRADS
jgi:hypothetical protein